MGEPIEEPASPSTLEYDHTRAEERPYEPHVPLPRQVVGVALGAAFTFVGGPLVFLFSVHGGDLFKYLFPVPVLASRFHVAEGWLWTLAAIQWPVFGWVIGAAMDSRRDWLVWTTLGVYALLAALAGAL